MGLPTPPQEAAPAYDDVFADQPVNGYKPSGATSAYAAVPQDDDVELHAHDHTYMHAAPSDAAQPHAHCEQCDVQLVARQRRDNAKHCCNMVAATFMTAFVCIFFGLVITSAAWAKRRRHA